MKASFAEDDQRGCGHGDEPGARPYGRNDREGLAVVQRTKLYQTDFDIQRGFLVGFSIKRLDLATYVFNPDNEPTFVLAVGVRF